MARAASLRNSEATLTSSASSKMKCAAALVTVLSAVPPKKGLLGKKVVEHVYDRGAWKSTKAKYAQVSNLFASREAARVEKRKAGGGRGWVEVGLAGRRAG